MDSLVFMPDMSEKYAIDQLVNGKSGVLEMHLVGIERRFERYHSSSSQPFTSLCVSCDVVFTNLSDKYVKFSCVLSSEYNESSVSVVLEPRQGQSETVTVDTDLRICWNDDVYDWGVGGKHALKIDCEEIKFEISRMHW
jgi:hypothetical protein